MSAFSKITVGGLTFEAFRAGDGAGRVVVRDETAERLGDNVPIAVLIPTSMFTLAEWLGSVHDTCAGKPSTYECSTARETFVEDAVDVFLRLPHETPLEDRS